MLSDYLTAIFMMSSVVACLSWTISRAKAFEATRNFITRKAPALAELVHCPYCVSHYVSLVMTGFAFKTHMFPIMFAPAWFAAFIVWTLLVWFAAFQWSLLAVLWKKADT